MRWPSPFSRRLRDWLPYAVGVTLLATLLISLAAVAIWQERGRQRERATTATQTIARLLDAHVVDVISQADVLLRTVALHHQGPLQRLRDAPVESRIDQRLTPSKQAAQSLLIRSALKSKPGLNGYQALMPALLTLCVADASGMVALGDEQGNNIGPREDFQQAQALATAGLIVRGPVQELVDGRSRWVLRLSRGLRDESGEFLGLVSADLSVDAFAAVFTSLQLGQRGAATLRAADLSMIYRHPWPGNGRGAIGSKEVSAQLRAALSAAPDAGEFVATTAVDGITRINAYRKVSGLPLYVLVGLPESDFPAGWNLLDTSLLLVAATTLLVAAYAALQLYRASKRQLDAVQRRYEGIVESSHDAIVSKSLDGRVLSWNKAAEAIFGWTADEMIGQPLLRLFPPDLLDEEAHILQRLQRGENVEAFDTRRLRKDGSTVAISVAISPVRDAQGQLVAASKIARDITRQKMLEEQIRTLAFTDALTRLPNRRLLMDRLERAQQNGQRQGEWGALLFIDLDHFKPVNDTHGHEVGDQMLISVSRRLQAAVREADTVARLGGDEFVVLCERLGADETQALRGAQMVRDKVLLALAQPHQIGRLQLQGSASVGIQPFLGTQFTPVELLRAADQAMYAVKRPACVKPVPAAPQLP